MAIADTGWPLDARASTSRSRSVNGFTADWTLISASFGSTTRPPAYTRRTAAANSAGEASLTRKPWAPASNAWRKYPGRSKVVTIRIFTPGCSARTCTAVLNPSCRGIWISSRATSTGCSARAAATSSPSEHSATTSMSASRFSSAASAPRTRCWSSAINTLIMYCSPSAQNQCARWCRPAPTPPPYSWPQTAGPVRACRGCRDLRRRRPARPRHHQR